MTQYATVKDDPQFKRDLNNGSLISTQDELAAYRLKRARLQKERDQDRKFRELESEVSDVKALLREILERLPKLSN